jgi:hypothetical protein
MDYWVTHKRTKITPKATDTRCEHGELLSEPCYACDCGHPIEWYEIDAPPVGIPVVTKPR